MNLAAPWYLFGTLLAVLVGALLVLGGLATTRAIARFGDPERVRGLVTNDPAKRRAWKGEIVIHVGRDVDGLYAAYVSRGVKVVEEPVSQPWGLREFAIREPDGHVLRFCGYL